jgi:hypothetical protein
MTHDMPAVLAAELERSVPAPPGDTEQFSGYGVMGAPFASGDVLAMRRFPSSSLGEGYSTVWHRTPEGDWTIYSDHDPMRTCPRYFGSALSRAVETPISVTWPAPAVMEVSVPAAELAWRVELADSATTRFLNALGGTMSDRMWRRPRVLAMMARLASRMLHSGRLGLSGHAPNGQTFIANPRIVWLIERSHATIAGRDLGELAALPEQVHLADFWIPQRGLFAFGRAFFEPLDATRHRAVTHA